MLLNISELFDYVINKGYNFFTGVPDSLLNPFLETLEKTSFQHVVATHESQAIGIAVGAYLAGANPCVYMQNSGLANAIEPLTSLCIPYGIYPLLVIGHRHTLPQHKIMGEIDEKLLKLVGFEKYIIVLEK